MDMGKKIKYMFDKFIDAWRVFDNAVRLWLEWQDAKCWAKRYYPAWVHLATCRNRPEINETYKQKIIRAYYDTCWR